MRANFGCGFLSEDVIDDSGGEGEGQNETWHHSQIAFSLKTKRIGYVTWQGQEPWGGWRSLLYIDACIQLFG